MSLPCRLLRGIRLGSQSPTDGLRCVLAYFWGYEGIWQLPVGLARKTRGPLSCRPGSGWAWDHLARIRPSPLGETAGLSQCLHHYPQRHSDYHPDSSLDLEASAGDLQVRWPRRQGPALPSLKVAVQARNLPDIPGKIRCRCHIATTLNMEKQGVAWRSRTRGSKAGNTGRLETGFGSDMQRSDSKSPETRHAGGEYRERSRSAMESPFGGFLTWIQTAGFRDSQT